MLSNKIFDLWRTRRLEAAALFVVLSMCAIRAFAGGHASYMPLEDALRIVVDSDEQQIAMPKIRSTDRAHVSKSRPAPATDNVST